MLGGGVKCQNDRVARRSAGYLNVLGSYPSLFALFAVSTFLVCYLLVLRSHLLNIIGIDDANICFVYARNLIHGQGFTFAPGGERVEGFTSLLWVLVLAPFFWFRSPERLIFLFNVGLMAACLASFYRFLNRHLLGSLRCSAWAARLFGLAAVLYLFCSPDYFSWSVVSLMDVGLWNFLNVYCLIFYVDLLTAPQATFRQAGLLCGVIFLLILVWPESLAFTGALLVLFTILYRYRAIFGDARRSENAQCAVHHGAKTDQPAPPRASRPDAGGARCPAVPAVLWTAWVLSCALLFAFRLSYFHYLFPNTYYAKVSPDKVYNFVQGAHYIVGFIRWHPVIYLCLAVSLIGMLRLVVSLFRGPGSLNAETLLLGVVSAFALLGTSLPLVGGGDHFSSFRFFQPFWPFYVLPLILATASLGRHALSGSRQAGLTHYAALVLFGAGLFFLCGDNNWLSIYCGGSKMLNLEWAIAYRDRVLGGWLNDILAHHVALYPTLGVLCAGGIAYAYHGPIFDVLGLNHVAMGHSPGDRKEMRDHAAFNKDVFWRYAPELFLPLAWPTSDPMPSQAGSWYANVLRGLTLEKRFQAEYTPCVLMGAEDNPKFQVFVYIRNPYLKRLEHSGIRIKQLIK